MTMPPVHPEKFFDSVKDRLGVVPDQLLAEELGCTVHMMRHFRHKCGIYPGHKYGSHYIDWSKIDPILGKEPDSELSGMFGVSDCRLRWRRKHLGISRCPALGKPTATPWPRMLDYFGKKNDHAIATILGCSPDVVGYWRRKFGIQAIPECSYRPHVNWERRYDSLPLGEMTDYAIGRMIGKTGEAVRSARVRRGIVKAKVRATCVCGVVFESGSATVIKYHTPDCERLSTGRKQYPVRLRGLSREDQARLQRLLFVINSLSRAARQKLGG